MTGPRSGHRHRCSWSRTTRTPTAATALRWGCCLDAAVVVQDGQVAWVGPADVAPSADRQLDLEGRAVLPGFVDTHTHLVFAGDRGAEFAARMAGERYDGGGIASTVAATRCAPPTSTLRGLLARRIAELRSQGTTTVEIKSGYQLTVDGEARGAASGPRGHHGDNVPGGPRRAAGVCG